MDDGVEDCRSVEVGLFVALGDAVSAPAINQGVRDPGVLPRSFHCVHTHLRGTSNGDYRIRNETLDLPSAVLYTNS